ncbi:MAG: hypothetical protein JRI57_06185 [Deltaproteobacteria bacterium]|nr:hypothetical protein [Deltaproteobacteria bacterium]MBW1952450.1 hypothetical protein [Deltaproteobacteria bacterium]MBW1987776.1 hypothetical protein [Deltaproteobacteria bacterium]MBW2134901.1 hypothetical protein [Deltaproteobacteria bacterium]
MNASLLKFTLIVMLSASVDSCIAAPITPPAPQADDHVVQGGSLAAEGKICLPWALPNDKK